MTNAELIDKLRILQGAILNPHHRDGEYVDKRFADVCVAAADALEADEKRIADLAKQAEHTDQVDAMILATHLKQAARIAELEAKMPKLPDRQEFLAKGSFIEEQLSRPKEAHWVAVQNGIGVCSNCNRQDSIDNMATHCRYCGAKMKTVTDCHTFEESER